MSIFSRLKPAELSPPSHLLSLVHPGSNLSDRSAALPFVFLLPPPPLRLVRRLLSPPPRPFLGLQSPDERDGGTEALEGGASGENSALITLSLQQTV